MPTSVASGASVATIPCAAAAAGASSGRRHPDGTASLYDPVLPGAPDWPAAPDWHPAAHMRIAGRKERVDARHRRGALTRSRVTGEWRGIGDAGKGSLATGERYIVDQKGTW